MSSTLTRYDRPGLPVAPEHPATAKAPRPEPEATYTPTLDASTTYDPHDRVPFADGEDEC